MGKKFLKGAASAPNFLKMQQSFNRWSNWACFEIVHRPQLEHRVDALTKLIHVAYLCRIHNNFNTSYSIVAGLELSPVSRLKLTWEKLPRKTQLIWTELKALFDINDNHLAYRTALSTSHPPIVPYLGLYSKTFLTLEDNPHDPIRTRSGLINISKLRSIYGLIKEIQQYQITPYETLEFSRFMREYFDNWSMVSEAELFDLSLICEPRAGAGRQLSRTVSRGSTGTQLPRFGFSASSKE